MDNHPIPQDVTGFQFKLIGNMTVKQFGYLASGIIFAWILFQIPVNILIKFPFCLFSAALGAALAYFPVSGRPMDAMIGNYLKALFRPTQFVYEKVGGQIYFPGKSYAAIPNIMKQYKNDLGIFPKDKLKTYLESLNARSKNKVDEAENNFLMSVSNLATDNTVNQPKSAPAPNTQPVSPEPILITHPSYAKATVGEPASPAPTPVEPLIKPEPLQHSIPQVSADKPSSEKQIKPAEFIIKGSGKTFGMPSAPDSPSVITGITKDARGNALSNILVEVKDKDGNPVRAFKTNEFGRFASATPLANGTYTIEFEDPKAQNRFEKMTINVTGQIIQPIIAVSIDAREELRKSLFNTN